MMSYNVQNAEQMIVSFRSDSRNSLQGFYIRIQSELDEITTTSAATVATTTTTTPTTSAITTTAGQRLVTVDSTRD